jgi:adenylate cyclase
VGWLVALLVVGVGVAALSLPVSYNVIGPFLDRRQLKKNDSMFFDHYCRGGTLVRFHRFNRHLPAEPRCKLCYVPFGGVGRVLGVRPSRKNSNFCRSCFEAAPLGGHETEIGVLFADARGFTAWSARTAPSEVAEALSRFYRGASTALMAHDAIIDKLIGDEVMAVFIADIPTLGAGMGDHMLTAAQELLDAAAQSFPELPVGIGLHCGTAWIGNVGSDDMKDFTALGDVVNLAARLQACAGAGEIVMSGELQDLLTNKPSTVAREFDLKGLDTAVRAHVLSTTAPPTDR